MTPGISMQQLQAWSFVTLHSMFFMTDLVLSLLSFVEARADGQ